MCTCVRKCVFAFPRARVYACVCLLLRLYAFEAMSTLFGFGIGCVDTDYGRVQVEICACITKSMKRRCSALYWHTARRWWRGSMVRASFERDAFLCLLSRVLGTSHMCVCVCVCVCACVCACVQSQPCLEYTYCHRGCHLLRLECPDHRSWRNTIAQYLPQPSSYHVHSCP